MLRQSTKRHIEKKLRFVLLAPSPFSNPPSSLKVITYNLEYVTYKLRLLSLALWDLDSQCNLIR